MLTGSFIRAIIGEPFDGNWGAPPYGGSLSSDINMELGERVMNKWVDGFRVGIFVENMENTDCESPFKINTRITTYNT